VWENLRGQICLGSDEFVEDLALASASIAEIPRAQRLAARPPLSALVTDPKDAAGFALAYLATPSRRSPPPRHLLLNHQPARPCGPSAAPPQRDARWRDLAPSSLPTGGIMATWMWPKTP